LNEKGEQQIKIKTTSATNNHDKLIVILCVLRVSAREARQSRSIDRASERVGKTTVLSCRLRRNENENEARARERDGDSGALARLEATTKRSLYVLLLLLLLLQQHHTIPSSEMVRSGAGHPTMK